MIVTNTSVIPLPGKRDELVAVVHEAVAYHEQRWPVSPPRMVIEDTTDGRIHVIAQRASQAEHEAVRAEQQADAHFQALGQKMAPFYIPGSWQRISSNVL
jgi:hypothetical protein